MSVILTCLVSFFMEQMLKRALLYFLLVLKIVIYGTLLTVQVVAAQNLVVARSY